MWGPCRDCNFVNRCAIQLKSRLEVVSWNYNFCPVYRPTLHCFSVVHGEPWNIAFANEGIFPSDRHIALPNLWFFHFRKVLEKKCYWKSILHETDTANDLPARRSFVCASVCLSPVSFVQIIARLPVSPTLFDCLPVCNYVLKLSSIKIDNFNWNQFALKRSKFLNLPTVFGWNVLIHGNVHCRIRFLQAVMEGQHSDQFLLYLAIDTKFRREILAELYSYAISWQFIFPNPAWNTSLSRLSFYCYLSPFIFLFSNN